MPRSICSHHLFERFPLDRRERWRTLCNHHDEPNRFRHMPGLEQHRLGVCLA
jgi:hypothetical protein